MLINAKEIPNPFFVGLEIAGSLSLSYRVDIMTLTIIEAANSEDLNFHLYGQAFCDSFYQLSHKLWNC